MPKKNKKQIKEETVPSDLQELEARIEKMLDPRLPDEAKQDGATKVAATSVADSNEQPKEVPSAPEVPGLPVPEKPLEIKVLRDEEEITPEVESAEQTTEFGENPAIEETVEELPAKPEVVANEEATEPEIPEVKEDAQTAQAVADIVAHESDALLAAEDEKIAGAFAPDKKKTERGLRLLLKKFWQNKRLRNVVFVLFATVLIAAALVPTSRYFVLNLAGVRVSSSVRVLDESTQLPLKNVEVSIAGSTAKTDAEGVAQLQELKLGNAELKIYKRAFAPETKRMVLGWGSNKLGDYTLRPTGTQYAFELRDFLSDKPITAAEAESSDASALANKDGKILLTIDEPADEFEVVITSEGRRSEKVTIDADSTDTTKVAMVPARPHIFISKQSGTYDVYKVDADGKNETLLLKGTGNERQDMTLVLRPDGEKLALVSSREGDRNKSGYLLSDLVLVSLKDKSVTKVAQSERIQLVDWSNNRLVYVQIAAGASASDPKRHRLMSYDSNSDGSVEIAASNYFNDVMMVHDKVYYAPSGMHQKGVNVSMFEVDPDGSNQAVITSKETWNIFRTDYKKLSISLPGEWHEYDMEAKELKKLDGEPANLRNRVYVDAPDKKLSAWVDIRDGKGVLISYDIESGKESVVQTRSGLSAPLTWLSESALVFRVRTEQETADYAFSLAGGEPKKIRDVTNTSGLDTWYYY